MKRSAKARQIGFVAWLLGLLFVVAGLVALFSLVSTERLARAWPLGIDAAEVEVYARWLDRRPVEVGHTLPDIYRFGGSKGHDTCIMEQSGPGWRTRWFETEGYGDSVDVRHLSNGAGYLLRFKKSAPMNGQRRVLLVPADVASIRAKYLEVLANELGLQTPGVSYVHVIGCGKAIGLFRKEERMDQDLIERRGLSGASLVKMGMDPTRPDLQFAKIEGDSTERVLLRGTIERALSEVQRGNTDPLANLVDERGAIAWLLMAWIDGRDLRNEPVWFAHQWATGRMLPLYCAPQGAARWQDDAPLAYNLLTPLLRRPDVRARFEQAQAELVAKRPELRERFAALNKSWLPVLADTRSLPFAQTTAELTMNGLLSEHMADTSAANHLDRPLYFGPGHASFLEGMPLPPLVTKARADTGGLRALAKRYKLHLQGDTIVFPRGKFTIDDDLVFPTGHAVVMLQGARLFLAPGVNLVCKGGLFIRGTLRNPVFIRPQDHDAPFGTIAVVGSGSDRCSISGLFISGGAGASIDGVPHAGMVTVRGMARTTVMNTVLEENKAAAALHVHGGAVELNGMRCMDGREDFIALEHTSGIVRDVQVVGKAKAGSANGLRIRSGQLAVVGGRYSGSLGAGISIEGAAQVLVRKAQFVQNATAIAAADRSLVHVDANTFTGNTMVLRGGSGSGARFLLYPNTFDDANYQRTMGATDVVVVKDALDAATAVTFGVQLNEPEPEVKKGRRGGRRGSTVE